MSASRVSLEQDRFLYFDSHYSSVCICVQVRLVVDEAYKNMSREFVEQHKNLRARERDNKKKLALKGDLSDDTVKAFEKRKIEYEKIKTSLVALCEALQQRMPELPPEPLEDETRLEGAGVWLHTAGDREVGLSVHMRVYLCLRERKRVCVCMCVFSYFLSGLLVFVCCMSIYLFVLVC